MGFTERSYDLLLSYLTDRKQVVIIEDTVSETKNVVYSVPQGTV